MRLAPFFPFFDNLDQVANFKALKENLLDVSRNRYCAKEMSENDVGKSGSSNRNNNRDEKTIEFGNCGIGDGSFITKHCALLDGLKKFPSDSYSLQITNIPGAMCAGYNYRLLITSKQEEEGIQRFLNAWAAPGKLMPTYNFEINKKKR